MRGYSWEKEGFSIHTSPSQSVKIGQAATTNTTTINPPVSTGTEARGFRSLFPLASKFLLLSDDTAEGKTKKAETQKQPANPITQYTSLLSFGIPPGNFFKNSFIKIPTLVSYPWVTNDIRAVNPAALPSCFSGVM